MKTSYLKLTLLLLFIAAVYFSCGQKGPKDLLLGTWQINDSSTSTENKEKTEVTFYKNGTAKSVNYFGGKLVHTDTMVYTLSADGKYLVTTEKANRVDSLKIVELTEKTLRIMPEHFDMVTINFIKK